MAQWGRLEHAATVAADTTSSPLYLPPQPERRATVAIHPGSTAKVQYTTSPESAVDGGTAQWIDWPEGEVSASTQDALLAPVTALRAVAIGADADWEVIA